MSWDGEEIKVRVPVHESILGDKLTAFAPKTTGILYSKNRPVEIVKQLYDIGFLYDLSEDLALIKKSYLKVVADEIGYRKLEISYQEVLKDTHEACLTLALRGDDNPEFIHLQTGITNITNFIIDRFKIEEAITAAAKVAHLCSLLRRTSSVRPRRIREYLLGKFYVQTFGHSPNVGLFFTLF